MNPEQLEQLAQVRLINQHVTAPRQTTPAAVVRWLGAVQAQDFWGALWAVGLRLPAATEATVLQALADRTVIRTWPMRGTLHFVAAADARWLLELLMPRMLALHSRRLSQQYGLDDDAIARCRAIVTRALAGGRQLTRPALYATLAAQGVPTDGQRGLHVLWRLAHERLICFGPHEGRQPTFVLLDEWLPPGPSLPRDEALAELARRYFTSHGPATLADFGWWSSLTAANVRLAVQAAATQLVETTIDGTVYWSAPAPPCVPPPSPAVYLLPAVDESTVAYRDRRASVVRTEQRHINVGNNIFSPTIVIDGQIVGRWQRAIKRDSVTITLEPFVALNEAEQAMLVEAVQRHGRFLGRPAVARGVGG